MQNSPAMRSSMITITLVSNQGIFC